LDRVEAGGKQWDQRLHEVPVRDGRTVGSRRRALGIDVDPLVVTGSVSERVNPVLELVVMAELGVSDRVQESHAIEHRA
jgi:hypothetical protein